MVWLSHRHFIEEYTLAFCHCPTWLFIQFQVIFNSFKQSLAERRNYSQFKLSFQNKAFVLAFDQTWYKAWQWYPFFDPACEPLSSKQFATSFVSPNTLCPNCISFMSPTLGSTTNTIADHLFPVLTVDQRLNVIDPCILAHNWFRYLQQTLLVLWNVMFPSL